MPGARGPASNPATVPPMHYIRLHFFSIHFALSFPPFRAPTHRRPGAGSRHLRERRIPTQARWWRSALRDYKSVLVRAAIRPHPLRGWKEPVGSGASRLSSRHPPTTVYPVRRFFPPTHAPTHRGGGGGRQRKATLSAASGLHTPVRPTAVTPSQQKARWWRSALREYGCCPSSRQSASVCCILAKSCMARSQCPLLPQALIAAL